METLKEITKILVNMVLWRKLTKEIIETTCCLCDIGLMICDLDMNILAVFCLNALSENTETHEYIRNSGISGTDYDFGSRPSLKRNDGQQEDDKSMGTGSQDNVFRQQPSEASFTRKANDGNGAAPNFATSSHSLFSRINYLLDMHTED